MKNKIFIGLLLVLSINSFAQDTTDIEKPRPFMLGGNAQFWNARQEQGISKQTNRTFGVGLNVGRMANSHWLIGVGLGMRGGKQENAVTPSLKYSTENTTFLGYIFGRYYVNPAHRFQLFLEPLFQIDRTKTTYLTNITSEKITSSYDSALNLGIQYQFNRRFQAIVNLGGIGYGSDFDKPNSVFQTNFGTQNLFFGFEYRF